MTLSDAIFQVLTADADFDFSLTELAEDLAENAGIEFDDLDDNFDEEALAHDALDILVNQKSSYITDLLMYSFTEENLVDGILNEISRPHGTDMEDALRVIYDNLPEFPNGAAVLDAMLENVYDNISSSIVDTERVGYLIGHEYWKYITNPKYGVKTNDVATVGSRISEGGYVYRFRKDISSYYYQDEFTGKLPATVGYEVKFREAGDRAVADFYPFYTSAAKSNVLQYYVSDIPSWGISIADFSDAGITDASKSIAEWLDANADTIIDWGIKNYKA